MYIGIGPGRNVTIFSWKHVSVRGLEVNPNLRNKQLLNHLETKQISAELIGFLISILSEELNQEEINERIDAFWVEITQPFFEWKIFFPLKDFDKDLIIENERRKKRLKRR